MLCCGSCPLACVIKQGGHKSRSPTLFFYGHDYDVVWRVAVVDNAAAGLVSVGDGGVVPLRCAVLCEI